MSKNWELEYAGAGTLSGDLLRAEYEHTPAGWAVVYFAGADVIATSEAPRHPSLRMLEPDAAGERRVVKTAFAVIDSLEEGMCRQAVRDVRATRRKSAPRQALA